MTVRVPKGLIVVLGIIALFGGVGVAGFFIGQASVDTEGPFDRGYDKGKVVGAAEGTRETEARYEPGATEYEAIYTLGRKQGYRTGKRAGIGAGVEQGLTAGEDLAFEGFAGGWQIGRRYIIKIGQGVGASKYGIPSRLIMETGESYNLCSDDADEICGGPL